MDILKMSETGAIKEIDLKNQWTDMKEKTVTNKISVAFLYGR